MNYPKAKVPGHPVLSLSSFFPLGHRRYPSLRAVGKPLYFVSGRYALTAALRALNCQPGDAVLLPAFHCLAMVEPVRRLHLVPVFYEIEKNAELTLTALETALKPSVKALIAVHYFGMPQRNIASVAEFCRRRGIGLIEDCAHGYFNDWGGSPPGIFGDYAIGSPMKFFPTADGGCLASPRHNLTANTARGGLRFQLKMVFNCLENAVSYKRLWLLTPFIRGPLWLFYALIKHSGQNGESAERTETDDGNTADAMETHFQPEYDQKAMSLWSRCVMGLASERRIVERRIRNYRFLHNHLNNVSWGTPLVAHFPAGAVPYVFPFVVHDPATLFPLLKRRGVPIIRFGEFLDAEIGEQRFPNSVFLSRSVFQFPCHQELREQELQWMVDTIKDTAGLLAN